MDAERLRGLSHQHACTSACAACPRCGLVLGAATGYVFTDAQAAISWGSKKQSSIALSSCEAEIVALSETGKEGVYLSRYLALSLNFYLCLYLDLYSY